MKTICAVISLALVAVLSSCVARGHAGPNSTGGRVSTPVGSVGAGVRY